MAREALAMITYGDAPSALLIADSDAAATRARETLAAHGARIRDVLTVKEAVSFLDHQVAPTLVWAELDEDCGNPFSRLFERLDAEAAARRMGVVVSAPFSLVDPIVAATPCMALTHLCDATEDERIDALAEAQRLAEPSLHDVSRRPAPKLQHISQEISRIANLLAELTEEGVPGEAGSDANGQLDAATIRSIIRARRLRDRFFPDNLFADPAWDMMLDLMAAHLEGRRVAVSSLCIAAAVPPTTALRWIKNLTDAGLFRRIDDPQDGRRVHVELTDAAVTAFERYLKAVPRASSLVV